MAGSSSLGSPAFQNAFPFVRERLVPAYADLKPLAFAYCQGSMVENLSNTADIDTVFVWQSGIPLQALRPPASISDETPKPRVWSHQECFYVAGQEFGVAHHLVRQWEKWLKELDEGHGCDGYPTPVIAAHGLSNGVLVHDPDGLGRTLQERLGVFPDRLRLDAPTRAREALPDYLAILESCASQNDGLLFSEELVRMARLLWIGWFSAQRRYWPLEKRLTVRLRLMGRNDLALAEEHVWASGPDLHAKLDAFRELADRLLSEMPH